MESKTDDVNLNSDLESSIEKVRISKSESDDTDAKLNVDSFRNSAAEEAISHDDASAKTVSFTEQKQKSTSTTNTMSSAKSSAFKSVPQPNIVKNLVNDVREMKDRIRKLEEEVATLHELLKVQDDINEETLAILPDSFENQNKTTWKNRALPRYDVHKQDQDTGLNVSQAMMMNNHAWYGDAFLFELMCQHKGYHPKEDNWFTSIHPFVAFEAFCKRMFNRKRFYRSCIVCIGYSDLFNAKAVTGFPMKQTLHALLNFMNEHGAEYIKVLSIPPARQMMKNVEYLKICQTTNKFFKAITKTHTFVDFINLDAFFMENSDESFTYIDNTEVQVQIRDNLLMRKVNDHFEIFIDPETAKDVIEYVSNYSRSSKGYETNGFNETVSLKRRSEDVSSPSYSAKRSYKSRSSDEFDDHYYREDPNERHSSNLYQSEGSHDHDEYQRDYEYRQSQDFKMDRNSAPPWLKKS